MTLVELVQLLKTTGYPVAYSHFTEKQIKSNNIKPPFICYINPSTDNFGADNKVLMKNYNIRAELYTTENTEIAEENLEEVLNNAEIYWESDKVFIDEEKVFLTVYEFSI